MEQMPRRLPYPHAALTAGFYRYRRRTAIIGFPGCFILGGSVDSHGAGAARFYLDNFIVDSRTAGHLPARNCPINFFSSYTLRL